MTQQFGGYLFGGPYLDEQFLPHASGVYVITDSRMRVLDVGEAEDLALRISNHDRSSCWKLHAVGTIAAWIHPMPGSSPEQRRTVEGLVRFLTTPTCGVK
jgi:hypothetical protein